MSESAQDKPSGAIAAEGDKSKGLAEPTILSTQPEPNQSWQITLVGKVIASKGCQQLLCHASNSMMTTIVTGANRGIGLGIAEVCLANSAMVVYSLDVQQPGEDFLALQRKHSNFRFVQVDVTNEDRVRQAVETIISEQGRIDGFVANAGMTKHQPALQFDREQLEQIFNLNVGLFL